MDKDSDKSLLQRDTNPDEVRTRSGSSDSDDDVPSFETIVFDSKMVKTSTQIDELAATWGGRRSPPDSGNGRLRRARSWSGGPPDDVSSEIRILRER